MALYDFQCAQCGHEEVDVLRKVEDRDFPCVCRKCCHPMKRKELYPLNFEMPGFRNGQDIRFNE